MYIQYICLYVYVCTYIQYICTYVGLIYVRIYSTSVCIMGNIYTSVLLYYYKYYGIVVQYNTCYLYTWCM